VGRVSALPWILTSLAKGRHLNLDAALEGVAGPGESQILIDGGRPPRGDIVLLIVDRGACPRITESDCYFESAACEVHLNRPGERVVVLIKTRASLLSPYRIDHVGLLIR
jgi:hypothetical protein